MKWLGREYIDVRLRMMVGNTMRFTKNGIRLPANRAEELLIMLRSMIEMSVAEVKRGMLEGIFKDEGARR